MTKNAICIVLFTFAGLSIQLSAQQCESGRTAPPHDRTVERLDLSDEQEVSMNAIHDNFLVELEKIHANPELSSDEKRNQIKKLKENKRDKINELLTEDQRQEMRQHRPAETDRRRVKMRTDEDVHTLVLEKRREFESLLSNDEKKIIRDLRAEVMDHRKELRQTDRGEIRDNERMEDREQMRERMGQLDPIIENHRAELMAIGEELEQKIRDRSEDKVRGHGRHEGRRGMEDRIRKERHFLLMEIDIKRDAMQTGSTDEDQIRLYPNPAKDRLNIEFETDEAGMVSIELLDKSGTVINVIEESQKKGGYHTQSLDVDDLKSGDLYYIKIQSNTKSIVEKFIKL